MDIKITTRHFNGSPELQERIHSVIEKLGRFNDTIRDVHIILDAEKKNLRTVEAIFNIFDKTVCVSAQGQNMHKAVESVLLKAERLLKKEKQKLKEHRSEALSELVAG